MSKESKTVFVVTGTAGQYEDTTTSTIAVYETRKDAEDFINSKKNWKKNSEKLSIDDETYYELKEEHSREVFNNAYGYPDDVPDYDDVFTDQRIHWIYYVGNFDKKLSMKVQNIIKKLKDKTYLYPSDEDIVSEIESSDDFKESDIHLFNTLLNDYNKADDMYNDNMEDEHFKNWLIKKGYSEEVVDASMSVNDGDDYSDYNTYYYIDEVNYYPSKSN